MDKVSDFTFIAFVALIMAASLLVNYAFHNHMYGIALAIAPLILVVQLYTWAIKKLAASVKTAQQANVHSTLSKISPFLAGNLSNIFSLIVAMTVWGTCAYISYKEVYTGSFNKTDFDNFIHGSVFLANFYFLIQFIVPLYSGYVAAHAANKSEILHGSLSTSVLFLYSIYSQFLGTRDPSNHEWEGICFLLDNALTYGAPILGAAGGYLYIRFVRGSQMPTIFRTTRIGLKVRAAISFGLVATWIVYTEYFAILKENMPTASQNSKDFFLRDAFILIDALVVLIVLVIFLLRKWIEKSKINQALVTFGMLLFVLLSLTTWVHLQLPLNRHN